MKYIIVLLHTWSILLYPYLHAYDGVSSIVINGGYSSMMDPILELLDTLLSRGRHKHYPDDERERVEQEISEVLHGRSRDSRRQVGEASVPVETLDLLLVLLLQFLCSVEVKFVEMSAHYQDRGVGGSGLQGVHQKEIYNKTASNISNIFKKLKAAHE